MKIRSLISLVCGVVGRHRGARMPRSTELATLHWRHRLTLFTPKPRRLGGAVPSPVP